MIDAPDITDWRSFRESQLRQLEERLSPLREFSRHRESRAIIVNGKRYPSALAAALALRLDDQKLREAARAKRPINMKGHRVTARWA